MSGDLSGFSLMELFRMEAESHTATLSAGLVALEGGSAAPETIEPLMRAAHSLKGAARIVGLDAAVRVAHAMEDAFVAAQKGQLVLRPEHVDILLRGVDFLVQIAQLGEAELPAWQADHAAEVDALVADLAAVKEGRVEAKPALAAPSSQPPVEPAAAVEPPAAEDAGLADGPTAAAAPPRAARGAEPTRDPDRDREHDRVVRVTAESLTRLMGLAGEALVQSHRLRPMVDALWRLRERQIAADGDLQVLEDRLPGTGSGRGAGAAVRVALGRRAASCWPRPGAGPPRACRPWARRSRRSRRSRTHSEDLSSRLHHEVLASRMRPLADGIRGFPRLVRDLARELGKEARFEVAGETTGVDRDILDRLEAPAEPPDPQRAGPRHRDRPRSAAPPASRRPARSAWRPATAPGCSNRPRPTTAAASTSNGSAPRSSSAGWPTAAMARRLGEAELLDFLFLPGFSTKEQVTAVSGRGVGLDVVQSMVHSVRGIGPRRQPARQGDAVHPPAPDHRLGHPRPAGRDRRRALRLPPEPDRPHPDGRPRRGPRPRGQAARPAGRPARRPGRGDPRARAGPGRRGGHAPAAPATRCRWWSPATAAIASAWWSTASWASATSASRRWTPGWARCRISAAPRCWRTAGRS